MKLLAGLSLSVLSSLAVAATHTATVPGAGSWTVPPGATEIQLEAIGGGGGGGGLGSRRSPNPGFASDGGSGARIFLTNIPVFPGQVITYFVGGGGGGGQGGLVPNPPFPGSTYAYGTGGTGGSSTNVFLDGMPIAIAGGGGAGASAAQALVPFVPVPGVGGNACGTSVGGAGANGGGGAQGGKGGAGGKGGSNGDLIPPLPWFQGGHDGYGGAGSGFGLSIGDGPGSGSGGFGGAGSQQSTFGTGGGGGGYGGGGGGTALGTVEDVGGGGAGGSMWLGMQSTTPNAPSCVPALNAGAGAPSFDAPGAAGGDGSLKITWTAAPAPVPTPSVQAVPGLNGLGILLLGLGLTAGGLVRRTGERSH